MGEETPVLTAFTRSRRGRSGPLARSPQATIALPLTAAPGLDALAAVAAPPAPPRIAVVAAPQQVVASLAAQLVVTTDAYQTIVAFSSNNSVGEFRSEHMFDPEETIAARSGSPRDPPTETGAKESRCRPSADPREFEAVSAATASKVIPPLPTREVVISGAAAYKVIPFCTVHEVAATAADKNVIAVGTDHDVGARAADHRRLLSTTSRPAGVGNGSRDASNGDRENQ